MDETGNRHLFRDLMNGKIAYGVGVPLYWERIYLDVVFISIPTLYFYLVFIFVRILCICAYQGRRNCFEVGVAQISGYVVKCECELCLSRGRSSLKYTYQKLKTADLGHCFLEGLKTRSKIPKYEIKCRLSAVVPKM